MESEKVLQFVDEEVTKLKFAKELAEFRANEMHFRSKGIIFLASDVFSIELLFAVPHIVPIALAYAVRINYANWDVDPPSIRFIDAFSRRPLQREEIKASLWQVPDKNAVGIVNGQMLGVLDLLQPAGGVNQYPFVCIPGVKEYHEHPAHSGDSWLLYRTRGEGKLCTLIDQLYRHSIPMVAAYKLQITEIKASIGGLSIDLNKLE